MLPLSITAYDALGRPLTSTDQLGALRSTLYGAKGQPARTIDALGRVTAYSYDDLGRITSELRPDGSRTDFSAYDLSGHLLKLVDAGGTSTLTTYDEAYRPIEQTKSRDGREETLIVAYDRAGLTKTKSLNGVTLDYNGKGNSYASDPYGLVAELSTSSGGLSWGAHYDYDPMNRRTGTRLPGATAVYRYDGLGRLASIPGWIDSFAYDQAGRLTSSLAANGTKRRYDYDGRGNLSSLTATSPADSLPNYALSWDSVGNLTAKNGSSYAYDRANRLTESLEDARYAAKSPVRFPTYAPGDVAGRELPLQLRSDQESPDVELGLDRRSASVGVDLGSERYIHELTLIPGDPAASLPLSSIELYAMDEGGTYRKIASSARPGEEGRIVVRPETPVRTRAAKLHCVLDTRDENLSPPEAVFKNLSSSILEIGYFAERAEDRYSYDRQGNRLEGKSLSGETSLGLVGTATGRAYDYEENTDRVRTVSRTITEEGRTRTETWAYAYDGVGNLVEKGEAFTLSGKVLSFDQTQGRYFRYEYDLWNRMTAAYASEGGKNGARLLAVYAYDPNGLRIGKTSEAGTIRYEYGLDGTVLREVRTPRDGPDTVIDFVYAGTALAGWTESSGGITTKYWATTDHLGSLVAATDEAGRLASRGDYSAFGERHDQVLRAALGPLFTGKDFDEDLGLYYFNARWYDPELGRFVSEDPARDQANWYAYCGNNPLAFTDPTGLKHADMDGTTVGRYNKYNEVDTSEQENIPTKSQAAESVKELKKVTKEGVRTAIAFSPVGDLNDAIAVGTGYDILYGEKLSKAGRALTAAGILIGSGKAARTATHVAGEAAETVLKKTDDITAGGSRAKKGETVYTRLGRKAHDAYNPGPTYDKKVTLPSGKKPDAVDFDAKIVRELKPDTPRTVQRGWKQVERYRRELQEIYGGEWTSFVDTYSR